MRLDPELLSLSLLPFDYEVELARKIADAPGGSVVVAGRLRSFADYPLTMHTKQANGFVLSWSARLVGRPHLISGVAVFDDDSLEPLYWYPFELKFSADIERQSLIACYFRIVCPWNDEFVSPVQMFSFNSVEGLLHPFLFRTAFKFDGPAEAPISSRQAAWNLISNESSRQPIVPAAVPLKARPTRLLYDVSDLYLYWGHSIRPTGIQRVQIELIFASLDLGPQILGLSGLVTMHYSIEHRSWRELDSLLLRNLIELVRKPNLSDSEWSARLLELHDTSCAIEVVEGDVLINLGSSWWIPDYHYKIQELQRRVGLKYLPFLHDVIPLVAPEHCAQGLIDAFKLWFRDVLETADHVLVNSRHSLDDITSEAIKLHRALPESSTVLLNAFPSRTMPGLYTGVLERLGLDHAAYAICVGTLEGRKNHSLLLRVWLRLHKSIERDLIPKLVFVGKPGFMYEYAQTLMSQNPELSDYVTVINQASDVELDELYEGARFTLFPSHYEGWGLPLTEAAAHLKLTVASSVSSIPEAASRGDILLSPTDHDGWYEAIKQLVSDPDYLEAATEKSIRGRVYRRWQDVAVEVSDIAGQLPVTTLGQSRAFETLILGKIYTFSNDVTERLQGHSALPLRRGQGWQAAEDWGVWTTEGAAELAFKTSTMEDHVLYLQLRSGPEEVKVICMVDKQRREWVSLAVASTAILQVKLPRHSVPEHSIRLVSSKMIDLRMIGEGKDRRSIGVGCERMMVCEVNDVQARMNFLDALAMTIVDYGSDAV